MTLTYELKIFEKSTMPPILQSTTELGLTSHPALQRTLNIHHSEELLPPRPMPPHPFLSKQASSPLFPPPPVLLGDTPRGISPFQLHKKLDRSQSEPVTQQQLESRQVGHSSRYKTELCRPFEENGFCKYGEKCQFAHGQAELRSMNRHPKYKTDLCRTFHSVGLCPYGPRCHFIHNAEESRAPPHSPPTMSAHSTGGVHSLPQTIPPAFGLPTIFDSPPLSTRSGGSSPDQASSELQLQQHYLGDLLEKLNIDPHESQLSPKSGCSMMGPSLFASLKCSSPTNSVSSGTNNTSFGDYPSTFDNLSFDSFINDSLSSTPPDDLTAARLPVFQKINSVH